MRSFLAFVLILMPPAVMAEVTGVYEIADGQTMELSYKDGEHMRMNMPGSDQFMLVSGDKTYMVRKQEGQWMAMDMAAMGKMMQQMGRQGGQGSAGQESGDVGEADFRNTGRTETIAGYEGSVYEVTDTDGNTSEVVLSDHEDIVQLSRGWVEFSTNMADNMGAMNKQMKEDMLSRGDIDEYGGILRVDDDMHVKSVSTDSKGSSHYELPEGTKVQDMSDMGGGMMRGR